MSDLENKVAVDKGALQMAVNVLRRCLKQDIAKELIESCSDIEQLESRIASLEESNKNLKKENEIISKAALDRLNTLKNLAYIINESE